MFPLTCITPRLLEAMITQQLWEFGQPNATLKSPRKADTSMAIRGLCSIKIFFATFMVQCCMGPLLDCIAIASV